MIEICVYLQTQPGIAAHTAAAAAARQRMMNSLPKLPVLRHCCLPVTDAKEDKATLGITRAATKSEERVYATRVVGKHMRTHENPRYPFVRVTRSRALRGWRAPRR